MQTLTFPSDLKAQIDSLDLGVEELETLEAPGWKSFFGGVAFGAGVGVIIVVAAT